MIIEFQIYFESSLMIHLRRLVGWGSLVWKYVSRTGKRQLAHNNFKNFSLAMGHGETESGIHEQSQDQGSRIEKK